MFCQGSAKTFQITLKYLDYRLTHYKIDSENQLEPVPMNTIPLDITPLFKPLDVKGWTLKNRIIMPPMVTLRNIVKEDGIEWYRSHAAGGVGFVIVEATAVNRFGKEKELNPHNLKKLVDAVHGEGALIAIQLFPLDFDFPRVDPMPDPADFSTEKITTILEEFRVAAAICLEAGFDGIEPHGAHGYPINLFFSKVKNKRKDSYGGNLENRMRFGLEIVKAIKSVIKDDMLLLYRHTPVGLGYTMEESLQFAKELVNNGTDILDISPASKVKPGDLSEPFYRSPDVPVPIIAVNEMDIPARALEALNEERADLIAVARGLIADQLWPKKVEAGEFDSIIECTRCNEKCFGHLKIGQPIECNEWPLEIIR